MAAPEKKTPEQIQRAKAAILEEIERERKAREKKGHSFTGLTPEALDKKLNRTDSPIITSQGWSNTAPIGGTINYSVSVNNPDPFAWSNLAVSVFVGNRNPITDNNLFLNDYDARFSTLAQPITFGFNLAPGASASFNFALAIPAGVAKTGYFGNSVLHQLNFHDVGKYLDRAVFFFGVV